MGLREAEEMVRRGYENASANEINNVKFFCGELGGVDGEQGVGFSKVQ